ncbi:aspartate/glutamate racemase family protein [Pacificitalea manganoxidans]|nr:aspartate/glutamate racemase family protein [Pacificitalea manganoxidans]MDR6308163.1 Asp/Glu/hydantoin racemase [Pacificitalea manganoxidans]
MRVLVINPNSSVAVTDGIADALAPLGAQFDVVRQEGGPETIRTDEHVAEAAEPLAARIAGAQADGYIIACFSDPGLDLARTRVSQPVVGAQEAAVLEACALADRFGIIALSERAIPRHLKRIEALGCMDRLVAELPLLDVSAEASGRDPEVYRHLRAIGETLRDRGAGAVVLGCAGMAQIAAQLQNDLGIPVIDPVAAAGRRILARLNSA